VEVADIFRDHGATWRAANAGYVSLAQLKVMSAIEPTLSLMISSKPPWLIQGLIGGPCAI